MAELIVPDKNINSGWHFFFPLLLITTIIYLVHVWQQSKRLYKYGNKLPGPFAIPLLGNALMAIGKKPSDFIKIGLIYADQYGYIGRGWLGTKLIVFLADPNDVEVILNSHTHIDKPVEYDYFKPWLGDGLLISSGEKWRSHRKMIAPTFHINILKSFMGVFNENSKKVVEKMKSEIGKSFDVHDYMSGVTVNILLETAMGIPKKVQDDSGFDYAMAVMKMCDIIHQRHYKFWLRPEFIFKFSSLFNKQINLLKIIHGLTNKVIKSKQEAFRQNKKDTITTTEKQPKPVVNIVETDNTKTISDTVFKGYRDDLDFNDDNDVGEKKRLAFLDLMLEASHEGRNNITDHEIEEEVNTIMFEGHDTTAAGCSFVLCLLGVYQEIQEKVYNEQYEIFGDSDRPVTFLDTLNMKYLERVILETLRLYPPVPIIARELKQDVKIVTKNYIIPAGATVVITPFGVHHNPKYYKDHNVFNPDNFLPENMQNRHYYSYIPFSAGPRSCVGRKYALLKLKVLLSTFIRNYKSISEIPEEKFELTADIILKRADGFKIKIEPRIRDPTKAA